MPDHTGNPPNAPSSWPEAAHDLIHTRQTILPKRLLPPAPMRHTQLCAIVSAAAAAPDHDQLHLAFHHRADAQRPALPTALPRLCWSATHKPRRQNRCGPGPKAGAPLLILLVVDAACGDADIDLHERLISAGCAVAEHAADGHRAGFGSAPDQRQRPSNPPPCASCSACKPTNMRPASSA